MTVHSVPACNTRYFMMEYFSYIKMNWFVKYWELQGWIIVMGCLHPPRLRHILGHIIMVLRLRDIDPIRMQNHMGMMLYIAPNTRLNVSFSVHQCSCFTHNTKASHEAAVKRICCYLQGTKDKVVVFNTHNILMVIFYFNEYLCGTVGT